MKFQTIFPKFGDLDIVLPGGFVDDTSTTDAMPMFSFQLADGNTLRLSIDFADKSLSQTPHLPRFCLAVFSPNNEMMHNEIRENDWLVTQIIIRGLQEHHTPHGANQLA